MKIRKNRSRKADSTVIATVILVSVTIALAFVAAFWKGDYYTFTTMKRRENMKKTMKK